MPAAIFPNQETAGIADRRKFKVNCVDMFLIKFMAVILALIGLTAFIIAIYLYKLLELDKPCQWREVEHNTHDCSF